MNIDEIRLTKEERDKPPTDEELKQFHSREEVNEHRVFKKAEPLIRQDEREKTTRYVVARFKEVDDLSLGNPDFVRRACNLIVEFEQELKATVEKEIPPNPIGCGGES